MSAHRCHAAGCGAAVAPKLFMCRRHWYTLPKPMRDAIWSTYRPGQERDKRPSDGYLSAARAAIEWLAAHEAADRARKGALLLPEARP